MKLFRNRQSLSRTCREARLCGTLGFVPTMGCLHEGHRALIRASVKTQNKTAVSIFVNPLQFGPGEDFGDYPRTLQADLELCRQEGVDYVFSPGERGFYPGGFSTRVEETDLSKGFCGARRPGHFSGVTTVVAKLLHSVDPTVLYLGQKDYQQCLVIRRMVRDLDFPVKVKILPTVREPSGLAVSSRNRYLSESQKVRAAKIHAALKATRNASRRYPARWNADSARKMTRFLAGRLAEIEGFRVQYAEIVDAETLSPFSGHAREAVALVAGFFGKTRLIDNMIMR